MDRSFANDHRRWVVNLTLLAMAQFTLLLGRPGIDSPHEGRVAEAAREMVVGGDWIVPRINGVIRIQKPPLPYWTAAVLWKVTGTWNEALARLLPALMGAMSVPLLIGLAKGLIGRTGALATGLIWVSTWFVVSEFRKAMVDPYLAFFCLLAVWAWVEDSRQGEGERGRGGDRQSGYLLLFWAALALAAMSKGPIALAFVAIPVVSYHLMRRNWPRRTWAHVPGLALMLAIAVPWPAMIAYRVPNALAVWRAETRADTGAGEEKSDPPYKYVGLLAQASAPWTVLTVIGAALARRWRRVRWPLAWLALGAIFLMFLPMKKASYLLPLMPPLAMLGGAGCAWALRRRAGMLVGAHVLAGALAAGVLGSVVIEYPGSRAVAVVALAIAILIVMRGLGRRPMSIRTLALAAAGFAVATHLWIAWIEPVRRADQSVARFAADVRAIAQDEPIHVIGGLNEAVYFHLNSPHPLPVFASSETVPADFHGFAIVRGDALAPLAGRAPLVLADLPHRRPLERIYLVRFW